MANQPAPEIDYDLIYEKLKANRFRCAGIPEITCFSPNGLPNSHMCLCYDKENFRENKCGTEEGKLELEEAYFSKTMQGKLKAILE
jgi:hypothetical protein